MYLVNGIFAIAARTLVVVLDMGILILEWVEDVAHESGAILRRLERDLAELSAKLAEAVSGEEIDHPDVADGVDRVRVKEFRSAGDTGGHGRHPQF